MAKSPDKRSKPASGAVPRRAKRAQKGCGGEDDVEVEDVGRAAMLAMLEAHGQVMFGGPGPSASAQLQGKRRQVALAVDADPKAGDRKERMSEEEDESGDDLQNEEWDDDEDLMTLATGLAQGSARARPAPQVMVFHDPSREARLPAEMATPGPERKAFMSSVVNKAPSVLTTSKKRKADETDEAHMASLDRSLATLITRVGNDDDPAASSSKLQLLLRTVLDPPASASASSHRPQNHPRTLRKHLAAAQLARQQAADAAARQSGVVRHKHAAAQSKKERRAGDGTEARRRREAKGIGGAVGKIKGGMLKLSAQEIQMGRQGKLGRG